MSTASRRRQVDAEVARIQKFDDALPKVFAWGTIAVFFTVAIVALVA